MLFPSLAFVVFALIFFAGWPRLSARPAPRYVYLILASFFFYGWWDWRFLSLILVSAGVDFLAGLGMERFPARRRGFLLFSLVGNFGILGVFKYADFAAANLRTGLSAMGLEVEVPSPQGLSSNRLPRSSTSALCIDAIHSSTEGPRGRSRRATERGMGIAPRGAASGRISARLADRRAHGRAVSR